MVALRQEYRRDKDDWCLVTVEELVSVLEERNRVGQAEESVRETGRLELRACRGADGTQCRTSQNLHGARSRKGSWASNPQTPRLLFSWSRKMKAHERTRHTERVQWIHHYSLWKRRWNWWRDALPHMRLLCQENKTSRDGWKIGICGMGKETTERGI